MTTEISYSHYCNLGALNNPGCFTRWDDTAGRMRYYYYGDLSKSCWIGYKHRSPG